MPNGLDMFRHSVVQVVDTLCSERARSQHG